MKASRKRNKFNLSNTQLGTFRMGELIPVGIAEVLPGDTFQHATQAMIRCAPLATPPMHPVRIDVRHFFVPYRLLWDDWEQFITGGPDGNDASVFPVVAVGGQAGVQVGSLADYLGIPPGAPAGVFASALPFRAYAMIWNEYFRDQDLQPELPFSVSGGVDNSTNKDMANINWEKDYFTTCRPWEQKGQDVTLPIGAAAPVSITQIRNPTVGGGAVPLKLTDGEHSGSGWGLGAGVAEGGVPAGWGMGNDAELLGVADLSSATAASVNELRLALALQRYQEARARYGSRYTEYLAYYGVQSPDARLQRPEYLGGGRNTMQFSEVLSSDVNTSTARLPGIFGGHGIGANRANRYRKYFSEHGIVVSLMAVLPQTMYPDGLFRHWNRRIKEDFYQHELAHIGQQQVLNKEVTVVHNAPDGVFGYQDRYDEYRRAESSVHGDMRVGQFQQDWHFARLLPANTALNSDFVTCQPSLLPFQVTMAAGQPLDTLYYAVRHQLIARRMIPARGSSFTF